jgi:hypothetical protein
MQATSPNAFSSKLTISGCLEDSIFAERLTQERRRYRICLRNPSVHELQAPPPKFHVGGGLMEALQLAKPVGVVHVCPICVR